MPTAHSHGRFLVHELDFKYWIKFTRGEPTDVKGKVKIDHVDLQLIIPLSWSGSLSGQIISDNTGRHNFADDGGKTPVSLQGTFITRQLTLFTESLNWTEQVNVPTVLNDLDDVSIVDPQIGDTITFNGVNWVVNMTQLIKEVDFDISGSPIYVGEAQPGTLTSAASWRMKRITFTGVDEDVEILYADGDGNFDNIWDSRLGLSYG